MASGNQVITPDTNKVLTQVTITKPDTLVAGNIKKDVVIGGVTGTFEGVDEQSVYQHINETAYGTASTISFTIGTDTYQANSGMTWYEWCNSAYNTAELTTENTSSAWVYLDSGHYVGYVDDVSIIVKGTDTIISGKHYIIMGGAPND